MVKKGLSYLWPIILERAVEHNQYYELQLHNGRILLNSKLANYSYGNLQLAFQQMFEEQEIVWGKISSALLLGMGLGGVLEIIKHKTAGKCSLTAVEFSATVINWRKQYFEVEGDEVVHDRAENYIAASREDYDLIVVDVYQEMNVPTIIEDAGFISQLRERLQPGGILIFNKVVSNEAQEEQFQNLLLKLSSRFKSVQVNHQMGINRFLIAKTDIMT